MWVNIMLKGIFNLLGPAWSAGILVTILGSVGGSLWAAKHFYDNSLIERYARESAEQNVQYFATNIVRLNKDYQRGRDFEDDVTQPFKGHDLDKLAKEKPGLVADRINDARKRLFDILEKEGDFTSNN